MVVEPLENQVIRTLGVELAQARVDIAFLVARIQAIKAATVTMVMATVVEETRAPDGYAFIRNEDVMTLQRLLG